MTGSQKSACVEELETRRERSVVRQWNNGKVRGGNIRGIFFIKKKEGHVHVSERSEKQNMRKEAQNSAHLASPMCFKHTLGIEASPQPADTTDI